MCSCVERLYNAAGCSARQRGLFLLLPLACFLSWISSQQGYKKNLPKHILHPPTHATIIWFIHYSKIQPMIVKLPFFNVTLNSYPHPSPFHCCEKITKQSCHLPAWWTPGAEASPSLTAADTRAPSPFWPVGSGPDGWLGSCPGHSLVPSCIRRGEGRRTINSNCWIHLLHFQNCRQSPEFYW